MDRLGRCRSVRPCHHSALCHPGCRSHRHHRIGRHVCRSQSRTRHRGYRYGLAGRRSRHAGCCDFRKRSRQGSDAGHFGWHPGWHRRLHDRGAAFSLRSTVAAFKAAQRASYETMLKQALGNLGDVARAHALGGSSELAGMQSQIAALEARQAVQQSTIESLKRTIAIQGKKLTRVANQKQRRGPPGPRGFPGPEGPPGKNGTTFNPLYAPVHDETGIAATPSAPVVEAPSSSRHNLTPFSEVRATHHRGWLLNG